MGECLYRVVARAISIEYRDLLSAFFLPDQYAVVTRAGCETVAWGAKVFTEVHDNSAILQLDVSNAFNTISRTAICEGLRDSPPPSLASYLSSAPSILFLLPSSTCPLANLPFSPSPPAQVLAKATYCHGGVPLPRGGARHLH